jgi:transcriptional regulator with XRE-family HTH domain
MANSKLVLLPRLLKILEELGENIKLARLRRRLTTEQVAERAGISRSTLWQIEKGIHTVSLGSYAQVLFVLGLEKKLSELAADDVLGRKLQDAEILVKQRAPKKKRINHE